MRIVTAADINYLPGVIALYNSFLTHASKHEFTCMVHDEETKEVLQKLNIPYLFVDRHSLPQLPTSYLWPEESMAMYSRLLIPSLFEDKESIWIDADALIVRPLEEVDLEYFPCAGVVISSPTIGDQVGRIYIDRINKLQAIHAGVILFNREQWLGERVLEKCLAAMKKNYVFIYAVQSVLSLALLGNFKQIPYKWDVFTSWHKKLPTDTLIAHFCGYNHLPWKDNTILHANLWEYYYNNGEIKCLPGFTH